MQDMAYTLHRAHRTRPGEGNGRREEEGIIAWLIIARNLIARNLIARNLMARNLLARNLISWK